MKDEGGAPSLLSSFVLDPSSSPYMHVPLMQLAALAWKAGSAAQPQHCGAFGVLFRSDNAP